MVKNLRLLGIIEGISMLVLAFIAMPLKYLADKPLMVKIVGNIHGYLFIALVLYALWVGYKKQWPFLKVTFWVLLGSIVPFGPFIVDKKILKPLA